MNMDTLISALTLGDAGLIIAVVVGCMLLLGALFGD